MAVEVCNPQLSLNNPANQATSEDAHIPTRPQEKPFKKRDFPPEAQYQGQGGYGAPNETGSARSKGKGRQATSQRSAHQTARLGKHPSPNPSATIVEPYISDPKVDDCSCTGRCICHSHTLPSSVMPNFDDYSWDWGMDGGPSDINYFDSIFNSDLQGSLDSEHCGG
jgi:hypothetical protein